MLNLGFFHWSLHWEMSTRFLEKEDFFVIVTDVTTRTGKWSVGWDRRLGEKLQWILTLIKPKDIHQWSWHTSEPWNGCSAYVSIISLMGLFFFLHRQWFSSQIHTSPGEVTEHVQLEENIWEEISCAKVLYSHVKSSIVIYCMRWEGPDGPQIQPSWF